MLELEVTLRVAQDIQRLPLFVHHHGQRHIVVGQGLQEAVQQAFFLRVARRGTARKARAAVLRSRFGEHGKFQAVPGRITLAFGGVNFEFLVQRLEGVAQIARRFAAAQQQQPLRVEREIHQLHGFTLQDRL